MKREVEVTTIFNDKNQPIITRAIVEEPEGAIAEGIAICSKMDSFNGKRGRKIALGRAFKALKLKENYGDINREEAISRIREVGLGNKYKGQYHSMVNK
jgi:hypothetical protein